MLSCFIVLDFDLYVAVPMSCSRFGGDCYCSAATMMGFGGAAPLVTSAIYVCNLPPGSDEMLLADHFGKIGLLKVLSFPIV